MAWEPIKTAPTNTRVLVCDDTGDVFIAKVTTLRWRDEAGRLINPPVWWQPLPEPPSEEAPAKPKPRGRKTR